jgi:hypothetical protein
VSQSAPFVGLADGAGRVGLGAEVLQAELVAGDAARAAD